MADSSSVLATLLLTPLQEAKEASANILHNASSPADLYANNPITTTGLTWGYIGGRLAGITVANGTVALTASTTNYIVALRSTGVVSVSTATTNWDNEATYVRTYSVITGASSITSYLDYRQAIGHILTAATTVATDAIWDAKGDLVGGTGANTAARLAVGTNTYVLTADSAEATGLKWAAGGSGAPTSALYVVLATDATLTSERVLTAGTNITLTDGGAGSTLTIAAASASRSPAIQSVTSAVTVTPTFSDDIVLITAQAVNLTLANATGTAIDGLGIVIRIKDNGTARNITYGSQYRAIGVTLPGTTVVSKTLYLGMIWNSTDTKLDVVAVGQEA